MKLTDEEEALRAGARGAAARWAIEHQIKVGEYLGAGDFVAVSQAHIMADTESLGAAGVEWLERLAGLPGAERSVRIPTITDPRGTDFAAAQRLGQQPWMLDLERRAIAALEALGVLMTNTCINYQTIMPPVRGEHVAYGDTGVVVYSNSVCGARSNFEGGPSALSAGLTGRTPRYGYHLDERRRATLVVEARFAPRELDEWGTLGGSLVEMAQVADLVDGRRATIPLLVVTSPQVKPDADRLGLTARIEAAGGSVLSGMCFYQSYAREMAEANGWQRLATNSAKLVNIIGGYGYRPALLSMPACIDAACSGGRIAR